MKLIFSEHAWEDYVYWQKTDKKILSRINKLIKETQREPLAGVGKPEPLKHNLAGYWSRRINEEHRMVYKVTDDALYIAQLRYHY
ncbi:Txe/YoeB family addiction module toxin [Salinispirillum marinum]|uniref:Putative mRNA interferase YoeB n=2 Tax=Saccharospirillaceae TaxID=255527 RepID=A0ABV8BJT7_9GAMM